MSNIKELFKDVSKLTEEQLSALEEYRKSVDLLSEEGGLNLEFNNKDQFHAALVMAKLFKTAKTSLKVFTGSFSGEISDNPIYLKELKESITNSNKSLEVVFEEDPNENSECLKMLKELRANKADVKLYLLNSEYQKTLKARPNPLGHFTIGDTQMFRYETDKKNFRAFCNFDDKLFVEKLNANFYVLKVNSSTLD